MENVNILYRSRDLLSDRPHIIPEIRGVNFKIHMGTYSSMGHAIYAAEKLAAKLHLRITDKSLKISQKRRKV